MTSLRAPTRTISARRLRPSRPPVLLFPLWESGRRKQGKQACLPRECWLAEGLGSEGPPLPTDPASSARSARTAVGLAMTGSGWVAREAGLFLRQYCASRSHLVSGDVTGDVNVLEAGMDDLGVSRGTW